MKKAITCLGGKGFLILLTLSFAGYILFERTGIFRLEPASYREIFHSTPAKILSIFFTLSALAGLLLAFEEKKLKQNIGAIFFFFSIVILVTGLWVSIYTRFEGKVLRAEGQSFNAFISEYIPQTLYMPREKRLPQVGITLVKLTPEPSADMKEMKKVTADILYAGRTTGGVLNGKLSSSWPLISDWTFVRITDFGYSVKYGLYDLQEKELESRYLNMKLFPPGAEEHFEAMFLGYLFYVRYYPDYVDNEGKSGTLSAYPKNSVFNLRIVRNKDIVFTGLLKPTEKLRFDNYVVSFPDVKMWVEISFLRDFGMLIAAFGLLLLGTGAGILSLRKT